MEETGVLGFVALVGLPISSSTTFPIFFRLVTFPSCQTICTLQMPSHKKSNCLFPVTVQKNRTRYRKIIIIIFALFSSFFSKNVYFRH